jgi:hypothetical protein
MPLTPSGDQSVVEGVAQRRGRRQGRGEELGHQVVAVALDRDARQAVGLAVDQAQALELGEVAEPPAQRDRALDPVGDQAGVDRAIVAGP